MLSTPPPPAPPPPPTLEELAFYYGTDKSHDDHKYVDLYASLFDPIKDRVSNMTEIGLAQGQSLQVWHDYFPNAHIWGVDIHKGVIKHAVDLFKGDPRMHFLLANSRSQQSISKFRLANKSMDIIIDDGDHYPVVMQKTLIKWWPYLRPGGLYIIEDIATGANPTGQRYGGRGPFYRHGASPLTHNASFLSAETTKILREHDCYLVDTLVGHRAFETVRKALGVWMLDDVDHNSHLLVIRRRLEPRTHAVHSNLASKLAMWEKGVRPHLRREGSAQHQSSRRKKREEKHKAAGGAGTGASAASAGPASGPRAGGASAVAAVSVTAVPVIGDHAADAILRAAKG